jgi:two-component system sensor histidine kinase BaeS
VLLLGLFAAGAVFMAFWALAAIFGLVEAPAIVTGAGIVAFVVVLVGGLTVGRMLRRMTEPLDALIEASGRIEAGDYAARVPIAGGGEMRSLARAFNQMSAQLQTSDEQRRAFLAEVTHELRTPLTVIQGQLEAIEDGVYEADPERVSALLAQARQMSGLIEDLHTISLAEVGGLELRLAAADLAAVAEETVAGYAPAAELAGVALRAEVPTEPVIVALDAAASQRVLGNLVSNALRYTPAGGTVVLSVRDAAPGGRLDITDSGRGMDPEVAAKAFERFEKGADSAGSGLGLAIARDLVEAQGGTIELSSTKGQGTRVSLAFPAPATLP